MGEVYRPEDFLRRREGKGRDLGPKDLPMPTPTPTLDELIREVKALKSEVEKIKNVLKINGISIK